MPRYQDRISHDPDLTEEKEWEDKMPGGLADKKKPEEFDQEQLEAGIRIEMEHTNDRERAKEIAMDHLTEDPDYYKKLKKIEDTKVIKESWQKIVQWNG